MSIQVKFFGTGSCSNYHRGKTAFWVKSMNGTLLFDCGENTYYQIKRADEKPDEIEAVFISHNHSDHIGGLPTLLWGLDHDRRTRKLRCLGPGISTLQNLCKLLYTDSPQNYPVEFQEMPVGQTVTINGITVEAFPSNHTAPGLMYSVETLGRKIFYTGDTRPTDGYAMAAQNADLLIHDCTYLDADRELMIANMHSSAREAGLAATKVKAKILALVHMSVRGHATPESIAEEARLEYKGEIIVPEDFQTIEL